jgi:hypothetical protein
MCLVADGDALFCTIRPDHTKGPCVTLPSGFAEMSDLGSEAFDDGELRAFVEQCAELIFNSDSEEKKT